MAAFKNLQNRRRIAANSPKDSPTAVDLKISERLFRCGDYAAYPSLNAAMKTGHEVAEMLS